MKKEQSITNEDWSQLESAVDEKRNELYTLRAENKRLREAVQYAVAQFDLPQDQYSRLELSAIEKLKRALEGKK